MDNDKKNFTILNVTEIDELIDQEVSSSASETIEEKIKVMFRIFKLVSSFKDETIAAERISNSARKLGLRSSSLDIIAEYKNYLQLQFKKI